MAVFETSKPVPNEITSSSKARPLILPKQPPPEDRVFRCLRIWGHLISNHQNTPIVLCPQPMCLCTCMPLTRMHPHPDMYSSFLFRTTDSCEPTDAGAPASNCPYSVFNHTWHSVLSPAPRARETAISPQTAQILYCF